MSRRVALVAVLTVAALIGGGVFAWRHYVGGVEQLDLLGDAARGGDGPREITIESAPRVSGGPTANPTARGAPRLTQEQLDRQPGRNILLVGIDARPAEDEAGSRADSVIILHVAASGERGYLISLPRDTRVQIPGHGTDKLNAAFAAGSREGGRAGGFELLALTVRRLTGLALDAGAIVDFAGLREIVDAVGGVELCVDVETTSVHIGWDAQGRVTPPYRLVPPDFHPVKIPGVRAQVYPVGCRHFAGWEALDYVRQRELLPDGDYGRQRHQQQLLVALAGKATSAGVLANPFALNRALTAIGDSLTFDGNGRSLTDWILQLHDLRPGALTMLRTNGGRFNTVAGGRAYESLDAATVELFEDARADRLDAWVDRYPDRVVQS
ncbi:LCP family protein [Dactylosporangium sp. AC04546]|uniref:LCP family protein n=1 Tax=Dactylosporangium sp. AC04546 TaxID=2862460 RepID=UPI001EDF1A8E|nr:LCP family protein [Dactylosporangium sp. AC04546]WVK87580.1 LCP family protein [Dactylosporangium sp. AC04546]